MMTGIDTEEPHPGYWPGSPFAVECGGNRRQKSPRTPGLDIQPGETLGAVSRDTGRWNVMFIWRNPDELYLLSGGQPAAPDAHGLVEQVDPLTLEPLGSSGPLKCGGHVWCGAMVAHADGNLYVVNGNHMHCLSASLDIVAQRELPDDRPYNGILVMPDGRLVTKELRLEGRVSRFTVLEPGTLEIIQTLEMPEPSMGRIASDLTEAGDEFIYAPGRENLFRYRYAAGVLTRDKTWTVPYRVDGDGSGLAWDTTLGDGRVWFHDNGDIPGVRAIHAAHPSGSEGFGGGGGGMGAGVAFTPVRLRSVAMAGGAAIGEEVTGRGDGFVIAPPVYVPGAHIAIGFDSGNGGLSAYSSNDGALLPLWQSDIRSFWQPLVYRDTGELIVDDFQDGAADDNLVVLDLKTGAEKARVATGSPVPNGMFPCPGSGRDLYYVSNPVVARVFVES